MRDPRHAFRPYIVKETHDARERLAAEHFGLDAVREKISQAAHRGEGALRLPLGPLTAELRDTEAARTLTAWCVKNGLTIEWADAVLERPNGLKLRTAALIITWIAENHAV